MVDGTEIPIEVVDWVQIVLLASIISLALFSFIMLISFLFNIKHMLKYGPIILVVSFLILLVILYLTRNEKNIFVTSLLNLSFIYPVGFMYATEKALPGFNIKEIVFFVLHYLLLPLSPFITFISASLGFYPIKTGKTFAFFY